MLFIPSSVNNIVTFDCYSQSNFPKSAGFVRLSPEITTAPSYTKRRKEKRALESLVGALSRHEKSRVSNWHSEALPAVP